MLDSHAREHALVGPALMGAALFASILALGCERATDVSGATVAPMDIAVRLDTPAAAADSLVRCLRAERAAVAKRGASAADSCRQALLELAARDEIIARYRKAVGGRSFDTDELVQQVVSGWGAVTAYYLDDLRMDSLVSPQPGPDQTEVVALVPAGSATLVVRCARGDDGLWRVAELDFQPPARTTTRPASSSP